MNKEDMILISVDDHIVEPPDMFKDHLQKKYLDEAPRLVHNPDGSDTWQFRDIVIPNVALNAVAGRPKEEYGIEPQGLDEIRPGCYKVDERVKDMNAGGILGSMCFPSFPGFAGRLFATEDHDFSLALVQAYNDWHVEEWCGAYPARFIPMTLPVIWDAEACAAHQESITEVARTRCFPVGRRTHGSAAKVGGEWARRAFAVRGAVDLDIGPDGDRRIAIGRGDGGPIVVEGHLGSFLCGRHLGLGQLHGQRLELRLLGLEQLCLGFELCPLLGDRDTQRFDLLLERSVIRERRDRCKAAQGSHGHSQQFAVFVHLSSSRKPYRRQVSSDSGFDRDSRYETAYLLDLIVTAPGYVIAACVFAGKVSTMRTLGSTSASVV